MALFIVRRLIGLVAVLFAITVLVFLIFFATPGVDPTRSLAGRNPTPETIAAVRHQFGLDRSKPMQYLLMMKRLFISRDLVSYGNQALLVVPAIASIRERAERIRSGELAKAEGRLGGLSESERQTVDSLTTQIVNKLLHVPIVRLKQAAATEGGGYVEVARHLFGLGEEERADQSRKPRQ